METIDFLQLWRAMPNISPTLKLVSMVLWLAVRDKASSVTFAHTGKGMPKLLYTPEGHGELEMVPPPRHYFPLIMEICRCMGREAAQNQDSVFGFAYTEIGYDRTLVVSIDQSKGDTIKQELDCLLFKLYTQEQAEELAKKNECNRKRRVKQLLTLVVAVILFVAVPILLALFL